MDRFAQFAFSVVLRDAIFVGLTAMPVMVGFSYNPPLAIAIGAHVALAYSLFLLYRVTILTDERVKKTEAWRELSPRERPMGEVALAIAHDTLEDVLLRFSKGAAGVACMLFIISLSLRLSF
jgi:hypothetical protein